MVALLCFKLDPPRLALLLVNLYNNSGPTRTKPGLINPHLSDHDIDFEEDHGDPEQFKVRGLRRKTKCCLQPSSPRLILINSLDSATNNSWAELCSKTSAALQEKGYDRTPRAISSHWNCLLSATRKWKIDEVRMLIGLTNDQIKLRKMNDNPKLPWPEHWRKVLVNLIASGN
jgi:hypothetical protein